MPKSHKPHPPEFRRQMVELVRGDPELGQAGRSRCWIGRLVLRRDLDEGLAPEGGGAGETALAA